MEPTLPHADHELTDAEILEHLGPVFAEYVEYLRTDPMMLVDLGEAAAASRRTRRLNAERKADLMAGRISQPRPTPKPRTEPKPRPMSQTERRRIRDSEIRARRESGALLQDIADEFGLSRRMIVTIVREADTP